MTILFENKIKDDYFKWLYDYVCKGRAHDKVSYNELFMFLHQIEFVFSIKNDINRAKDGVDLRYRFGISYDEDNINDILDILDGPCSVLEMMVALAIRCENAIMADYRYGDRTSQWFWNMMNTLGIGNMTDEIFDREKVEDIIYRFLDRDYEPNGKGGLFYIRDSVDDLRDVEIWTQLCWYLYNFD